MTRHLRPEARRAAWRELDNTQRDAFVKVVKMLAESVAQLADRPTPLDALGPEARLEWLQPNRSSRTVFLSGDRGTGKTTVLLSLADSTLQGLTVQTTPKDEEFEKAQVSLQQRLAWLEPLDMEVLPSGANLLAAILVRVEESARQATGGSRADGVCDAGSQLLPEHSLPELSSDAQRALLELQKLQRLVTLGWDSNLEAREGQLDADTFSLESVHGEHARLSLAGELERVLRGVSRHCFNATRLKSPLFVLPVDDVDLNPPSCLHLLRLLRIASAPHLFTIVLGDQRVAELVLNLKFSHDLASIAGERPEVLYLLSVPPEEIGRVASEVAANALRKLLPPAQRIHLSTMELLEAVNFRPLGSSDDDLFLHELMDHCPLATGAIGKRILPCDKFGKDKGEFCSLRDMLLGTDLAAARRPAETTVGHRMLRDLEGTSYHTGTGFLRVAPRRLADLWQELRDLGEVVGPLHGAAERLVTLFALKCRQSLVGDVAVYPAQREAIQLGIGPNPEGKWELGRLPLRFVYTAEAPLMIEVPLPRSTVGQEPTSERSAAQRGAKRGFTGEDSLQLLFAANRLRSFEARQPWGPWAGGTPPPGVPWSPEPTPRAEVRRRVRREVAAELAVFHDLLAFRAPAGSFSSPLLPPEVEGVPWACAEWQQGDVGVARVAWPAPPLSTFWEYDLFLHRWNRALERNRKPGDQAAICAVAVELGFAWLALGTSAMDCDPVIEFQPKSRKACWTKLSQRLDELAKRAARAYAQPGLRDWLANVALLLMPESGLAWLPEVVGDLESLASAMLIRFWDRHKRLIKRRRAERLAELMVQCVDSLASTLLDPLGLAWKPNSPLAELQGSTAPNLEEIKQFAAVATAARSWNQGAGATRNPFDESLVATPTSPATAAAPTAPAAESVGPAAMAGTGARKKKRAKK